MKNKNILIVSGYIDGITNENDLHKLEKNKQYIKSFISQNTFDYIVFADAGYIAGQALGLTPNLIIGDFDSSPFEDAKSFNIPIIKLPEEKDITDLNAALIEATKYDMPRITILGGMGGRLDHTFANIAHIVEFGKKCSTIEMIDAKNYCTVQFPSKRVYSKFLGGHFSVFSYSEKCVGINYTGSYYPLNNATLTNRFPLGVSNSFNKDAISIDFKEGILLVIISKEK